MNDLPVLKCLLRLYALIFGIILVMFTRVSAEGETLKGTFVEVVSEGMRTEFALETLAGADESCRFITGSLGYLPEGPVTIILTTTDRRFGDLTGNNLPEWGAAVALPGNRIVVSPLPGQKYDLHRILAHEIVHVVIDNAAKEAFVPRWFHEGCAQYLSGEWGVRNMLYMSVKVVRGEVLTFEDIQNIFVSGYSDAAFAYDLSMLAVRRLVGTYGKTVLPSILRGMRNGADFPTAFYAATGLWPSEYEGDFLGHVRSVYGKRALYTAIPGTWTAIVLLAVVVYIIKRRRTRRLLSEWEVVEAAEKIIKFPEDNLYD